MDIAKRPFFYIYSGLIFLPALYRLYLPLGLGDYAYYAFAFLFPVVAFLVTLLIGRIRVNILLALLMVLIVLCGSWLLSSGDEFGITMFFHGFKVYMIPILMFMFGYHLGRAVSGTTLIKLLLAVVAIHLVFSLLFYFDVLYSPMYDAYSSRFSENWVSTVGDYKAFTGLTLSKFDLAYQVGFALVGLLLTKTYFKAHTLAYFLAVVSSIVLVVFTFNKTMWFVLILTIIMLIYKWVRRRSRTLAYTCLSLATGGIVYGMVSFLSMAIGFSETFRFMSPQTFWSRVIGWEEAFHFDFSNLWRGLGAGYFDLNKIVLDSQYLYTYLELGLLWMLLYFGLLVYIMYQYSPKNDLAKLYIGMLFVVFVGGDMLNALSVLYVGGLFFAQVDRIRYAPTLIR